MQTRTFLSPLMVILISALVFACSDDENDDTTNATSNSGADAGDNTEDSGTTSGGDDDVPTFGDDVSNGTTGGDDGCDEAAALIDAWPLNDAVAQGAVSVSELGGVFTASVDAAAGGTAMASSNPFTYVDMDTGAKADISDFAAVSTDTRWELGLRRSAIFINSGDYPGSVEIVRLTGVQFDTVTAADIPGDGEFISEEPVDDNCEVVAPTTGFGAVETVFERLNPDTTSGSWYNYSMGAGGPSLTAYEDHVYILRNTDQGKTYKMGFLAWSSGVTDLRWAELQ